MMKKVLVVLAVAALAMPAMAAVDYFPVTADGSFGTHTGEGYFNMGAAGSPRLYKDNQHMGFLGFDGAVGDSSAQSIADFLAANGGSIADAKLYICAHNAFSSSAGIIGLRSGNVGAIVEDGSTGAGGTFDSPASGIAGASEPFAFRSQDPALNTWTAPGMGVGEAWIRPSNSATLNGFAAGDEIVWNARGEVWTSGTQLGYNNTYGTWALQYLIGQYNRNGAIDAAKLESAGQLVVKDALGNPVAFGAGFEAVDVRGTANELGQWYAVDLNDEIIQALASDPEMKGLGFYQKLTYCGSVDWSNNQEFVSVEQWGGVNAAYIALNVVPEPATLALLAMSGLALIRRRK